MAYTNIDDPSAHFQAFTYTGNQSSRDITLDGNSDLQPDLYWYKARNSNHHYWVDSSRGTTKYIYSSLNNAEATVASAYVTSFNTNGFNVGGGDSGTNAGGISFANWVWKANGGTTSTNTDGGITTTVQANTDAGFSIVTYAGTGTSNTIGHGLGVTPDMMIVKNRSAAYNWAVYHKDSNASPEDYYAQLNTTNSFSLATDIFGTSPATSSVIGVKNFNETNASGSNYVAYCFASKQGYSKFGKYVGNGNANGSFVYTGFKPAFVMIKPNVAGRNWQIIDNSRDPHNAMDRWLQPNLSASEFDGSTASVYMDFLSNGFKLRTDNVSWNQSAQTIIYMAFAENPFTTSTGIPTTAR